MVRYGFIHTKEDIKFLVLFAMDLLPFPVSFSTIVDLTTWCDEGFGYFELSEAFYEMVPTGRRRHPHRRHRARPERPDRPHGNGAGVRGGNERRQSRTGCHARAYL